MATFKHQHPRNYHGITKNDKETFISEVKEFSKKSGFTIDQTLKCFEILEISRATTTYVANGDIHDEHMMGFADIYQELVNAIEALPDKLNNNSTTF